MPRLLLTCAGLAFAAVAVVLLVAGVAWWPAVIAAIGLVYVLVDRRLVRRGERR